MQTYQTSGSRKEILRIATPLALSLAFPQFQQYLNTAFIGHYSTLDQSVMGISGIIYLVLLAVSFGMSSGAMIIFSRYSGKNEAKKLGRSYNHLFFNIILIMSFLCALYFLLLDDLIPMVLENQQILTKTLLMMEVLVFTIPIFSFQQLCNSFFVSIGRSKLILQIAILGFIFQILLDYVLIFGKWGFPEMGILGSAYAMLTADLIMLIYSYVLMYNKNFVHDYGIGIFNSYQLKRLGNQMKICFPLILQILFALLGWLAFFVAIEHRGEVALASSQIIRSAIGLSGIPIYALSQTANSFTSNLLGQSRQMEVRKILRRIAQISFAITLVSSFVFWFLAEPFLNLMTIDPAVVMASIGPLKVCGGAILLQSLSTILFNGIIGTGKVKISILIETTAVIVYLLVLFYVLIPANPSLTIMWSAEFLYWGVMLILSLVYMRSPAFLAGYKLRDY